MPNNNEKKVEIFVPGSPEELGDALEQVTGSSDVDDVRAGNRGLVGHALNREWMVRELLRFTSDMDVTGGLGDAVVDEGSVCDADHDDTESRVNVDTAHMFKEAEEGSTPKLRKFSATVPFTEEWSHDFIHAADLLPTVGTIITDGCKDELIEGENIVALDNFRMKKLVETNDLDVWVGFPGHEPIDLFKIGQDASFTMSFKTDKDRNIFVIGKPAREGRTDLVFDRSGIPGHIVRHAYIGIPRKSFRMEPFDDDLRKAIVDEFKPAEWAGTNLYLLLELVTRVVLGFNWMTGCFGGEGFQVASFKCESLPESNDYLETGFDGGLSVRIDECKVGRSGSYIAPIDFAINCPSSGKKCKGTLTIACPRVSPI